MFILLLDMVIHMRINPTFPKSHKPLGKYLHIDSEHYHFACEQGKTNAETALNKKLRYANKAIREKHVPLSIYEIMDEVERSSFVKYSDCPIQMIQRYRKGK